MAFPVLQPIRMLAENAVVAVCNAAADAEAAVAELRRQGVANGSVSVVTVEEPGGSKPSAYYVRGGCLRRAPDLESCRQLWETLSEFAVLVSPGERAVVLGGPLAASVVRALDQEELFAKLGPLAGGLYNLGITRDAAREFELAALQGHSLVIVHGRAHDVARARRILAPWLPQAATGGRL